MKILNREKEIQNDEKITIPIDELQPFEEHPYKVLDDEEMEQLVESIRENGVLTPILVTHLDLRAEKYDIVSGHRRYAACKKLGVTEIPAVYKEMTYDEAVITMVDANLQREHILPSEKAKAYLMKFEAMQHQGRTSGQLVPKPDDNRTMSAIGSDTGESYKTVQRYIRLNNLIPELLQMVDEGRIALTPAVELSYLTEDEQKWLLETIETEEATPSLSQAQQMKNLSQSQILNMDEVFSIMVKPKPNQKEVIKIKGEVFDKYLKGCSTPKEREDFLLKACEYYSRFLQRQKNKDRGAR